VKQAAADRNIANVFRFNTPSDLYSGLIGTTMNDKSKSEAVGPGR
jgi:hypothetical protein